MLIKLLRSVPLPFTYRRLPIQVVNDKGRYRQFQQTLARNERLETGPVELPQQSLFNLARTCCTTLHTCFADRKHRSASNPADSRLITPFYCSNTPSVGKPTTDEWHSVQLTTWLVVQFGEPSTGHWSSCLCVQHSVKGFGLVHTGA